MKNNKLPGNNRPQALVLNLPAAWLLIPRPLFAAYSWLAEIKARF